MNHLAANRLTRKKQLQMIDAYHTANLQAIRTARHRFFPSPTAVTINQSKKAQLQQLRNREIKLQNKSLLERMGNIRMRHPSQLPQKNNRSRSLNETFRLKQQHEINLENLRFVESLSSPKPTLNRDKTEKEWKHHRKVVRVRANNKSHMTDFTHATYAVPQSLPFPRELNPQSLSSQMTKNISATKQSQDNSIAERRLPKIQDPVELEATPKVDKAKEVEEVSEA